MENPSTFSFSHLPSPEHLVQVGAAVPLPSQLSVLQGRYNGLPTPDQLVPDLFTRVAQGLQPLRKPQAADIQSAGLRGATNGTSNGASNASTNASTDSVQAGGLQKPASEANKPKDTAPEEKPTTEKPVEDKPDKADKASQSDKPSGSRTPQPKKQPQYLTREQLMTWERELRSNTPAERQKAAADIQMFLGKHPETMQNPLERRAMAALTLNLLKDTDVVVRNMAFDILSMGRIQFTRAERNQSPYKELAQRIDRLLKIKDPIYALADYERFELETLKKNWDRLTTLQPAPPDTEAIPA